jgi:FAD/FMN-containing dehydrogenase
LLWAARGAGPGFFAAVTSFDLRVYEAPRGVLSSAFAFPLSAVGDVASWIGKIGRDLDKRLEVSLAFARAPAALDDLGIAAGEPVVVATAVAFTDSVEEGMALLEPLERGVGRRGLQTSRSRRETPQQALYEITDARLPRARRVAADCLWTDGDLRLLFAKLSEALVRAPGADSWILVSVYPAQPPDVEGLPSAFSSAGRFYIALYSLWEEDCEEAPSHEAWLAGVVDDLEPLTAGRYVGEADLAARPEEARRCYRPDAWERLATTRERYDPRHVFAWYPDRPRA